MPNVQWRASDHWTLDIGHWTFPVGEWRETMAQGSLGEAIRNFFRGVVSLLTTGSWKVEEWAENARSADALLDRVPEEVDIRAQQVLDDINEAITAFAALEMKAQRYRA